ncbi:MAG TPA: phage tail tube protein [bacterium]|nr:phage tail tube protein [bacterium]
MSTISLGRKEQLYALTESTYGTPVVPGGAGAIKHLSCTLALNEERTPRADRKITRGLAEQVRGKRSVEWSIDGYVIPSGSSGAAPDIAALLAATFSSRVSNAATVAGAAGVGGATLSSVSEMAAGDIVGLVIDDSLYAVCLQTVDDLSGAVTWTPALPSAPTIGDPVHQAVTYRLQTEPNQALTLHRLLDQEAQTASGCVPNEWNFSLAAGDMAKCRVQGQGKDLAFAGTAALQSSMDGAQTTLVYTGEDVFEAGAWIAIDDEAMKIAAVTSAAKTLTVVRAEAGTSAATHEAAAVIAPYRPTPSTSGSPIAGVRGRCLLDGANFTITAGEATIVENVKLRNDDFGSATAMGFAYPAGREATMRLEGFLTGDTGALIVRAKSGGTLPVLLQAGDRPGATFAIYAPAFAPNIPEIDAPADAETPLVLEGPALETNGDDELIIAFL